MTDIPTIVALSLAALFAVIGIVQVTGPRFLRDAYRYWDYSQRLRVVTGLFDIGAAAMLAQPHMRGWGITFSAVLIFGSVVTLLNHRQYACAAAATLMMAALVPAVLAIPREKELRFIEPTPRVLADTR